MNLHSEVYIKPCFTIDAGCNYIVPKQKLICLALRFHLPAIMFGLSLPHFIKAPSLTPLPQF